MISRPPGRCGRRGAAARPAAMAAIAWRRPADSPILPFGELRGVLLCRHHFRDGSTRLLIRELTPTIQLRTGMCCWTSTSTVIDLARPKHHLGDPLSLKPWQKQLNDSLPILMQLIESGEASSTEPVLPYTLLAVPNDASVEPRPTKAIQTVARRRNVDWLDAWHQVDQERRAPATSDLRLIDTRLCDRLKPGLTWPGAVALYHDLRDVPLTHAWRPPLSASVPESLFIYLPHACLDGWNAPEPVMHRLAMEHFPAPLMPQVTPLAMAG